MPSSFVSCWTELSRAVYLAFDSDLNGAGQQAACRITQHLRAHGVGAFRVELPQGHDPNSFFVHGGGDACQFQELLRLLAFGHDSRDKVGLKQDQ
jgi:hypothetical protein